MTALDRICLYGLLASLVGMMFVAGLVWLEEKEFHLPVRPVVLRPAIPRASVCDPGDWLCNIGAAYDRGWRPKLEGRTHTHEE